MSKQVINTGSVPNDNTGDTLRQGATKVNANFTEIYSTFGDGTTLNAFPSNSGYANTAGVSSYSSRSGVATYSSVSGVSTNSVYFNNQLPAYYLNYQNHTNTPQFLSQFANNVGFITSTVGQNGFVCGGILTATTYRGDGSQLTGIATATSTGVLQAQINALGTNLNIVGFYDATLGIVTGLTIVGQGRTYIGLGQTLASVGIVTGDYFIVSIGGTEVGISTYSNPGISSVYSGDWIVGISSTKWSILSYSQQVVAPRATRSDYAKTLDSDSSVNTSGIITASEFWGNGGALTNLTSASSGTYGNSYTVPQIQVNNQGKITNISNVAIALTDIGAGIGTVYWNKGFTGISTTSNVGIGTEIVTEALEVYGSIKITPFSSGAIKLSNSTQIQFGSSNNADIFFDGSDFKFLSDSRFTFTSSSDTLANFNPNGSIELYYDNNKKLETIGAGVTVIGSLYANQFFGNGSALTGVVTSINSGANISIVRSGGIVEISASGSSGGGTASWGFSTSTGIGTTSNVGIGTTIPTSTLTVRGNSNITGTLIVGGLSVTGVTTLSSGRIQIPGTSNIKIGNSALGSSTASVRNIGIGDLSLNSVTGGLGHNIGFGEFSLYGVLNGSYNLALGDRSGQELVDGSYNVILGSFSGKSPTLDISQSNSNIVISDGQGNVRQYINSSGNVGIKTTIVKEALTVAGVVSATSFYGTLNASQLTGSLPAIDGSALTGVTAVGSGVEIRNNNTPLGVAATINFGSNINITLSSGIATVTGVTSVTNATTAYALAGTPNLNVGIVTAARLVSSGASLTSPLIVGLTTATYGIRFADDAGSGSSTYVVNVGTSHIQGYKVGAGYWQDRAFQFSSGDGFNYILPNVGIGTTNPTSKLTVSGDGKFTGVVTATSFFGSGSGLTNIPAGQLTGTLPAIDGSALLNVTAAGTGIVIRDDNDPVGSAVTVNFGTGLGVTFSSGIATITSTGGSLQSRITVSGVTTSIPYLGIGNTNILGFKSYALMNVGLSTAGWIRLYTDVQSRTDDANRSVGEDPEPGSGIIAEVITTGISTQQMITPFVMGGNMDNPVTSDIYVAITNLSGTTQTITANLTILQLEA